MFDGAPELVHLRLDIARVEWDLAVIRGRSVANGSSVMLSFLSGPVGLGEVDSRNLDCRSRWKDQYQAFRI